MGIIRKAGFAGNRKKDINMIKRNEKGQFLKGHSGNTTGIKRETFTAKFLNGITLKDISEVRTALLKKAKGGDMRAIKLFLDYCINPPTQVIAQTVEDVSRSPEDIRQEFKAAFQNAVIQEQKK